MSQKKKVLIGDDKSINRYVLRGIFEDTYDIIECKNGDEIMQAIKEEQDSLAVILLDLVMPNGDGFFVLDQLKEEGFKAAPVVVITANLDDEVLRRTYSYEVADYIQKPFQEDVVRQRVLCIIRRFEKQSVDAEPKLA